MKKLNPKRDGVLRVIKWTQSNGRQISLLATDKQLLCYQPQPNRPWEPVEPEYIEVAAAIGRL